LGITIFNSRWSNSFDWKGGSLSIKNKINDTKLYFKAVPSLRKHNIIFMDQLIDRETKTVLPWKIIQTLSNSSKGPIPSWFETVKSSCANEYGVLKEKWQDWSWEEQDRRFFSKNINRDQRRWSWKIMAKGENGEEILWYRSKGNLGLQDPQTECYQIKRGSKLDSTKLQKVEVMPSSDPVEPTGNLLDPMNSIGGNKRSQSMPLAVEILNLHPTLRKSSELEIPISLHVLENQVKKAVEESPERGTTNNHIRAVEIEDFGIQIIKDHIDSPEYIQALAEEYRMNKYSNYQQTYCFYTDGSFGKAKDLTLRMGAAWLQEKGPNPGRFFQAGVDNWPSALRAELVAIILALLVVPQKSQIEIRTDNSTCINTFQKLQNPQIKDTGKRNRKCKNWQLWMRCIDLIQKKQITVQMTKVKAHSNDTSNNKVDLLAKEAKEEPEIIWTKWYRQEALTTLCWNEIPIDIGARDFIKELYKRKILMKWAGQNRIQKRWMKEINDHENFDWREFWEANRVGEALETSPKKTREKSFRIKMMHNELPTLDNMNKRFPKEYGSLTNCIYCRREKESLEHLLSCPDVVEIRKEIWNEMKDQVLNKWPNKTQEEKNQGSRTHISALLEKWYTDKFSQGKSIIDLSLGLFPKEDIMEWSSAMEKFKVKKSEAKFLLYKWSRAVCKQIRKKIWNDRCSRLQNSGRKPEIKKQWKGNHTKTQKRKKAGPEEQEDHEAKDPADQEEAMNEECKQGQEQSEIAIWRWIKEGKKWLGI
jgi:ribonuclease HI